MAPGTVLGILEGPDLLIVLALALLLFGGTKLPQLARSLGQAKKEFQAGVDSEDDKPAPTSTASDTVTISREELEALKAKAAEQTPDKPAKT